MTDLETRYSGIEGDNKFIKEKIATIKNSGVKITTKPINGLSIFNTETGKRVWCVPTPNEALTMPIKHQKILIDLQLLTNKEYVKKYSRYKNIILCMTPREESKDNVRGISRRLIFADDASFNLTSCLGISNLRDWFNDKTFVVYNYTIKLNAVAKKASVSSTNWKAY